MIKRYLLLRGKLNMIECNEGILKIGGEGYTVSQEMGIILHYFVEDCTQKELETALNKFMEELSYKDKVKFLLALRLTV